MSLYNDLAKEVTENLAWHKSRMDLITADEYYRRQACITFDDIDAVRSHITCIPSSSQLGDIKGLPGQVLYCADTDRCYVYYKDYQWQQLYNYMSDTDYTSYYKAKTDALQAQKHAMRLYEDTIKSITSCSGNKIALDILEEDIGRVKDH